MCAGFRLVPPTVGQVFRTVAEYRITRFNRFLSERSALMGRVNRSGILNTRDMPDQPGDVRFGRRKQLLGGQVGECVGYHIPHPSQSIQH